MRNKFHGVFSLLLIIVAIFLALASIWGKPVSTGLVYLAIVLTSPVILLYTFCAKCLCRSDDCRHVFPGKLTQWFPRRKQGPYTFADIVGTVVSLAALVLFPQYWLWQNKTLWLAFWLLIGIASIEILAFVCRGCKNARCPIHSSRDGDDPSKAAVP
ncbi:MAG: hypothetical protein JSW39_02610 [Desulfobacterales bacterium]|nr:MAG: hypothetical protein JSW39_02610 [Desulfobacterales bacterium]